MFSFLFQKSNKKKKNIKPVRSLFWVGAFLLLLSFLIVLPIYKNAKMTPDEHWQEGLKSLQEGDYSNAKTHILKSAQAQNAKAFFTLGTMELEGKNKAKPLTQGSLNIAPHIITCLPSQFHEDKNHVQLTYHYNTRA